MDEIRTKPQIEILLYLEAIHYWFCRNILYLEKNKTEFLIIIFGDAEVNFSTLIKYLA